MSDAIFANAVLAYAIYVVAAATPGPANFAVMATSMREGRASGLWMTAGVMTISGTWGLLSALGLAALLQAYAGLTDVIRVVGGGYLLWLGWRAARTALRNDDGAVIDDIRTVAGWRACFLRGAAIHATNPKSIFAWLAIMAVAVRPGMPAWLPFAIVALCWVTGIAIVAAYAILFSTNRVVGIYRRASCWIEGGLAIVFGAAGIKLVADAIRSQA